MSSDQRPPMRASRRAGARRGEPQVASRTTQRADAVREIEHELEHWRAVAIPDASMPLEAEDIARLVGDCLTALNLDEAASSNFTVNTVHYYRRKEILDAPEGRTSAARYTVRHLWQAIGARLAGQLGLVTLAEAREAMSGRGERVLLAFVAERVLDARARQAVRRSAPAAVIARPLAAIGVEPGVASSRPIATPNGAASAGRSDAVVFTLPGDVVCVIPAAHPAHRSASAARALGRALTDAFQSAIVPNLDS